MLEMQRVGRAICFASEVCCCKSQVGLRGKSFIEARGQLTTTMWRLVGCSGWCWNLKVALVYESVNMSGLLMDAVGK